MNGFYAIYFTGTQGTGFGLLILKDGIIVGADVAGGVFDGNYKTVGDQIEGELTAKLPAGVVSITGQPAGPNGLVLEFPLRLPVNLGAGRTISLQSPNGPINVNVKKLRDL